jgi:long-chain acyl-CoA synthetase
MSNTRATAADSASLDTFPRLLMHHARQRPNRPAMREKEYGIWQTYTWAEVAERVRVDCQRTGGAGLQARRPSGGGG